MSEYLDKLVREFKQEVELTKIASNSMLHHSKQLVKLNEMIFDECGKENININDLKLL